MVRTRRMPRSRQWCFTWNNYSEADLAQLGGILERDPLVTYLVYQEEVGESGTSHLQGFVQFGNGVTMRSAKNKLGSRTVHLEKLRGTPAQARAYCMKDDTRKPGTQPVELGVAKGMRGQGALDLALAGAGLKDICDADPSSFLRYHSGYQKIQRLSVKPRNFAPKVVICYGESGTGKSSYIMRNGVGPDEPYQAKWPGRSGKWWWDNYEGQETVCLDEFRHQIKYSNMLTLIDRHQWKEETKGGHVQIVAKKIFITTNIHPKNWYPGVQDKSALKRRFIDFCTIVEFRGVTWNEVDGIEIPSFDKRIWTPEQVRSFEFESRAEPNFSRGRQDDGGLQEDPFELML